MATRALPPIGRSGPRSAENRRRPSSEQGRSAKEKALPRSGSLPPVTQRERPKPAAFRTELEDWKRRNGVPAEARVFSITGAFPGVRKALQARGWVENEDKQSRCWDFKYALWQRDIGEMGELDETQVVNYFARNAELTSKVGLCNSLYNCCTLDRVDVDSFYPRCYDFTNLAQARQFVEDFQLTTCRCLLRRFVEPGGHSYPLEVVQTALDVCRRQARSVDDALDEAPAPSISEAEWNLIKHWSLKTPGKRVEVSKKDQLARSEVPEPDASPSEAEVETCSSDPEGQANDLGHRTQGLHEEALSVLQDLSHPQSGLDGRQNIWVLKPAGKSRGRGIQLSARLEKIQEIALGRGAEARWIAQKYIENPLIVNGKKFDIRQWVLVTRWCPLAAWFYEDCYLRFSFADYNPKRLKNKYAHLTNNSISKHAEGFEEEKDDTMWHSEEFREFLKSSKSEVEDPWAEVVQPAMKFAVLKSLEAAQDNVVHRASSFELFGYDFMVDEDLKVWLIEINSSPDLSYSTSTTKQLVKQMIEDMMAVVVDVEKFGYRLDRPKRKWGSCRLKSGGFQLLEPARRRREEKFPKLRKDAQYLAVQGTGVKLRKPKKGE
ncbi:unnamed protein product [Effrenium voratum]|nr:unnamed protein product [Effrenium voratum]CAJ1420195.1 unnamed protein product [Effrenium voratum]